MLRQIKRLLPLRLKTGIKHAMGMQDMETRLRNLHSSGFRCTSAVDVGAFAGEWSVIANSILDCAVIAVEPQPSQQSALQYLAARLPLRVESIALADRAGEMPPLLEETNSRLVPAEENDGESRSVNVVVARLDEMLLRHSVAPKPIEAGCAGARVESLGWRRGYLEPVRSHSDGGLVDPDRARASIPGSDRVHEAA